MTGEDWVSWPAVNEHYLMCRKIYGTEQERLEWHVLPRYVMPNSEARGLLYDLHVSYQDPS